MAALTIAVPFAMACGESDVNEEGELRIEISLKEFAFQPEAIRIPAGRPVTLVIKNDGLIPHEFMAGREAEDGHFEYDLFEGVEVSMTGMTGMTGMMGGEMAEDHDEADEADDDDHADGDDDAEADHADGDDDGDEHAEDDHGTMILAEVSETVTMSFTLPESLRGTWSTGCFLPGHYEAGMRGTLIVE